MDAFVKVIIMYGKILSVKQNLGLVRLLGSHALGKLTLRGKIRSVKQNIGLV